MARTERKPHVETAIPVYVPTTEGEPMMGADLDEDGHYRGSVAKASLRDGKLVLEFKDNFPAMAIQRLLSRGALMGLQFILHTEEADTRTDAEIAADNTEEGKA